MLTYIARRFLYSVPVLIVSTFLSFTFVSLAGLNLARIKSRASANSRFFRFPVGKLDQVTVFSSLVAC